MDKLLMEFVTNTELHQKVILSAQEKGISDEVISLFMQPEAWMSVAKLISKGEYHTEATTVRYLDKITGNPLSYNEALKREFNEVRQIYVMEEMDRIIWAMFYQVCYQRFSDWIDDKCKSYKKGESTVKTVKELSKRLTQIDHYKGVKVDLSKFFDSVPIDVIDETLAEMEKAEPSCIWEPIKEFYHTDKVIVNGKFEERFCSLKQGCAFGCLLADLVLRKLDKEMEKFNIIYYRYCDDVIFIGRNYLKAYTYFKKELGKMGLKINDKKTELLSSTRWLTFLGFRVKKDKITLSVKMIKKINHKIREETIFKCKQLHRGLTEKELRKAVRNIQKYMFVSCPKYPKGGLSVYLYGGCNVIEDISMIDKFIKDCIRAAYTNRCEIYGLKIGNKETGLNPDVKGKNVAMNMFRTGCGTDEDVVRNLGYRSLVEMNNIYHAAGALYKLEVKNMKYNKAV